MNSIDPKLRNRISDRILDHPFTDYWDIFVLKHQHPLNIALHIIGIFFFYGLLLISWKSQNYWSLLGLPITQLIGLAGHFYLNEVILIYKMQFSRGELLSV